jgi:predicted acylesterase/phospholipase RssA
MAKKADAVFEGGGVKGIGLVGAVSEIEKAGYTFENLAGTSAGSIVASLLAVGYNAANIKTELEKLNYNEFKDEGILDKLGAIGKALSIGFEYGIYEGEFFENWLEGLVHAKGKTTFGDIIMPGYQEGKTDRKYKYRLQVVAADLADIQHLTGRKNEHEHSRILRTGSTAGCKWPDTPHRRRRDTQQLSDLASGRRDQHSPLADLRI